MFLGVCQKCRVPLKVDVDKPLQESSLLGFGSTLGTTLGPGPGDEEPAKHASSFRLLGESFVVLGSEDRRENSNATVTLGVQSTDLDRKITALTNIFEVASDKCQFDHPMCSECSQAVLRELDRRLQEHQGDRDMYEAMLRAMQAELVEATTACSGDCGGTCDGSECERRLCEEEEELEQQLAAIRTERHALDAEQGQLTRESEQLEAFEQRYTYFRPKHDMAQKHDLAHLYVVTGGSGRNSSWRKSNSIRSRRLHSYAHSHTHTHTHKHTHKHYRLCPAFTHRNKVSPLSPGPPPPPPSLFFHLYSP
jgi:hypothetical protein